MNVLIADTAGQEKLKALSNQYYQKADGVLLEMILQIRLVLMK